MAGPRLTARSPAQLRQDAVPSARTASPAARLLVVGVLVGLAAVLLFVTSLPALCPMRVLLHVPCPSCGLTRAARLALGGHFAAATHLHPLWFLVLPYVGTLGVLQLAHYLAKGELARIDHRIVHRLGYALLALLVVVWVARFLGAFGGPCPV